MEAFLLSNATSIPSHKVIPKKAKGTVFWDNEKIFLVDFLNHGHIINGLYNASNCCSLRHPPYSLNKAPSDFHHFIVCFIFVGDEETEEKVMEAFEGFNSLFSKGLIFAAENETGKVNHGSV